MGLNVLARARAGQGRWQEADALFEQSAAKLLAVDTNVTDRRHMIKQSIKVLESGGRASVAKRWQRGLDGLERSIGRSSPATVSRLSATRRD